MSELKFIAEIYEKGWKKVEVSLTSESLIFGNQKINFKEIVDLELVNYEGKEAVRIFCGRDYYFNFGEKQKTIFRYLAFNMKSDKFAVYFLSPAMRGGVLVTDSKWEKGYFSLTESAIWFLSPNKQLRIPIEAVSSVNKDKRTVGDKLRAVLSISYLEEREVVTSFLLCPETTLDLLLEYMRKLIESKKPKEKLSELEEQVLTMVFTGLNSANIESILGITTEDLNKIYDKFVSLGIAKVVKIRKEIELTAKGAALVNELSKKLGGGKGG